MDEFTRWKGLLVAVFYGTVSISITFFNKAVFSVYNFQASNTLTLGQIVFCIAFLVVMKRRKLIEYPDFRPNVAITVLPLSVTFCGMAITGLAALRFVNVPMYSALRRMTTFMVIAGQFVWLNKVVPMDELMSVVVMVLGSMIAGWGDLTFDLFGYLMTAVNCLVTAAYLILISSTTTKTGLKTFGLMYYNNLLSFPMVLVIVLLTEKQMLLNYEHWNDIGFHICFWMSSVQAFLLNYSVFLCSTINSPLTTSITGQLKSILSTLLGLVLFGGVMMTFSLAVGLLMSTFGGVWYAYIKYTAEVQAHNKLKPQKEKEKDPEEQRYSEGEDS